MVPSTTDNLHGAHLSRVWQLAVHPMAILLSAPRNEAPDLTIDNTDIAEVRGHPSASCSQSGKEVLERRPRIVRLTPYSGNNLGDAAIQDAMIAGGRRLN